MFILRSINKMKRILTFDKMLATPQTSTPIITQQQNHNHHLQVDIYI